MAADLEPDVGSIVAALQKGDAVEGRLEAVFALKGCLCGALQVQVDLAGCHGLALLKKPLQSSGRSCGSC